MLFGDITFENFALALGTQKCRIDQDGTANILGG